MRLADFIEGYTTERSRQAIKELLKLAPETARVERNGVEVRCRPAEVARGEVVPLKSGERIPVDGVVVDGHATVNQAPITGESVPVEKQPATRCSPRRSATAGRSGFARSVSGETRPSARSSASSRRPRQRRRRSSASPIVSPAYYIPVVIAVAAITYLVGGKRDGRGGDGARRLFLRDRDGDADHGARGRRPWRPAAASSSRAAATSRPWRRSTRLSWTRRAR